MDRVRSVYISDYFQIVWVFGVFALADIFLEGEINDLVHLLSLLETVSVSLDRDDERIWHPDSRGGFFVKSFYKELQGHGDYNAYWKWCRNSLLSPKVLMFYWLARL